MSAKTRLVDEIAAALAEAAAGLSDAAALRLHRIARDPDAGVLGQTTAAGLPRKLHSAWLALAKIAQDPSTIAGLRATAVPPADLIEPLFAATAARSAAFHAAAAGPVPRVLNQIWIGGPPPAACGAWRDYAAAHGWSYRLWDETALQALPLSRDPVWTAMRTKGDLPGAVDVARYHLLLQQGGVYLDCDWYPARADLPPQAVIPMQGLSVLAEAAPRLVAGGSLLLSNALIAVPPDHPALRLLLDRLPQVAARLPGAPAWWATGPLVFTMAARQGPVTVLGTHTVAATLSRGATLVEARAAAAKAVAEDRMALLIAWKGW